jgi:hypothetical protein
VVEGVAQVARRVAALSGRIRGHELEVLVEGEDAPLFAELPLNLTRNPV